MNAAGFSLETRSGNPFVAFSDEFDGPPPLRLLIFADRHGATQEISFLCALSRWRSAGAASVRVLDEPGLAALRVQSGTAYIEDFLERQFALCRPNALILSRFCGVEHPQLFALARAAQIPVICHLDDNLLDPPITLGTEIWRRLKHPRRLHALYEIIAEADLVYTSTPALAKAIGSRCSARQVYAGAIYVGAALTASPRVARLDGIPNKQDDEIRIGYMGSASHEHDLEMIAPALLRVLEQFPRVSLHLFGSVAATDTAQLLADRALLVARVHGNYGDFRQVLGGLEWDIGLAPLRPIEFNNCKAPTKCVEYLEAGIAPIASDSPVYQPLAEKGAVLLAGAEEWADAISALVIEEPRRRRIKAAGRELLMRDYSWERLERQVIDVLATVNIPLAGAA